ncbi:MAG TPA: FUSC family protein [Streptosporangiaceae bacterium]
MRQKRAPVPWLEMLRAAVAICVPLSVALVAGKGTLGVLPAMGGLLGTLADTGGPYLTRVKRVASACLIGGAVGLTIGGLIHGHGWVAVIALVVMAGVSAILSAFGDLASVAGLQLLVYTALGFGPVGAERPVWHTAAGFLAGAAWAVLLILPGWLWSPHGKEQRDVAQVYSALAGKLSAIGTSRFASARQDVTAALNTAYDELLTARSVSSGRNRRMMRLIAVLNASHQITEASTTLGLAGDRPPPLFIDVVRRLGSAVQDGRPAPFIPPAWDASAGARALRDALAGAARAVSGAWSPTTEKPRRREWEPHVGRLGWIFTARLMACMLVAGIVSEILPLQRSYWVPLTVAIVLKPDYGSVFGRALQRGIGTVIGAVLGAVVLTLVHGTWLLIPFAILAALLPFGRSRSYGLLAVFLTPLVVVLIDLLEPSGWHLALDRLQDTLIGCLIVVVIGFAPWWSSWYAHLPGQFVTTAGQVSAYLDTALLDFSGAGPVPDRSRMRRRTYRALADLRAEFQRTMSEPTAVSRRASAWWPAVVGLEDVMDAVTATALEVRRGDLAAPSADDVRTVSAILRAASTAAAAGAYVPPARELPGAEGSLEMVTGAVRSLLGVLATEEDRLTTL